MFLARIPTSQAEFYNHPEATTTYRLCQVVADYDFDVVVDTNKVYRATWWQSEEDPKCLRIGYARSTLVGKVGNGCKYISDVKISHYYHFEHYAARLSNFQGTIEYDAIDYSIIPIGHWTRVVEIDRYIINNLINPETKNTYHYDHGTGYEDIQPLLTYVRV